MQHVALLSPGPLSVALADSCRTKSQTFRVTVRAVIRLIFLIANNLIINFILVNRTISRLEVTFPGLFSFGNCIAYDLISYSFILALTAQQVAVLSG